MENEELEVPDAEVAEVNITNPFIFTANAPYAIIKSSIVNSSAQCGNAQLGDNFSHYRANVIEAEKRIEVLYRTNPAGAQLIGSMDPNDTKLHRPALDIDLPCELRAAKTPRHYHLFIDQPMHWEKYEALLVALAKAGIINPNYAKFSIAAKQSFLRAHPHSVPTPWGS